MQFAKIAAFWGLFMLVATVPAYANPVLIGGFLFTNTVLSASFSLTTLITAVQVATSSAGATLILRNVKT